MFVDGSWYIIVSLSTTQNIWLIVHENTRALASFSIFNYFRICLFLTTRWFILVVVALRPVYLLQKVLSRYVTNTDSLYDSVRKFFFPYAMKFSLCLTHDKNMFRHQIVVSPRSVRATRSQWPRLVTEVLTNGRGKHFLNENWQLKIYSDFSFSVSKVKQKTVQSSFADIYMYGIRALYYGFLCVGTISESPCDHLFFFRFGIRWCTKCTM